MSGTGARVAVRRRAWSSAGAGRTVVGGVAFAVLFTGSWRPAWSADETATIMVVRRSWGQVLRTFWYDAALEPYYLVMRVWSSVSTAPAWMRLPSVLAMAAAVAIVWTIGHRVAGPRVAAATVAILLSLPTTSAYAQDARPYAFGVLFVVLLVSTWLRAASEPRPGDRRRLTLLVLLAGLAHPYALAVVPVLVVACRALEPARRRTQLRVTVVSATVAFIALAPFLLVVALRANGQPHPADVTLTDVVLTLRRLPAERLTLRFATVASTTVWLAALLGLLRAFAVAHPARRTTAWIVSAWLLGPAALLCLLQAVTGSPGLVARYWLFSLPALAIAAALLVDAPGHRRTALGASVVLVGALLVAGWPSQTSLRAANGHLGQGWARLPRVLELPLLRTTPLLTANWNYHGLVANDPRVRSRMPLVRDPDPSGRILPQTLGPGSPAFARLVLGTDRVVVLATLRTGRAPVPTVRAFAGFAPALRHFTHLDVACAWFDQALGVFSSTGTVLTATDAQTLRRQLTMIAPRDVRCSVGGAPRRHG